MCVEDGQQAGGSLHLRSGKMDTQIEERDKHSGKGCHDRSRLASSNLDSICENTAIVDNTQSQPFDFVPVVRSGEWSDIGGRQNMEDTHVCIADLAKKFGLHFLEADTISFYGVFDGHGGKGAADFVRENLPKLIVEDADFPSELEKVVTRSFINTDAKTCSLQSTLSSGTTALTAMIFGRSLLVANAGDCRAILSRRGVAVEMSKDHRPSYAKEERRVKSLGGYFDLDGYLNGELNVTRALGDWHIQGMKSQAESGGPLSAEPELKMITLTKEDEFLIIGSDGVWDVFTNQNAVDFARRRLQEHNDVKRCCMEVGEEAIKRGSFDNLTVVIVCFHRDPPPQLGLHRNRVKRSISAEGLHSLKRLLEG
ncbi:hypothetical protein H6P81_000688 [Aristolochia fimbriata]|uniref:protein-serine/threonine phosphatase n=1 Tax=Aristolochia fimbriata TaxID=158543 RepID=A0AAV7F4U2_ARIFI|nr:hypothetical protein H6P81_000688 [Aristolochia fimbriata]